jgi:8-amino-7-oxononanoate synthase
MAHGSSRQQRSELFHTVDMEILENEASRRLADIAKQGLTRRLRAIDSPQQPWIELEGRPVLNFSSNDYLGLAQEDFVRDAAITAIERYGTGSGASRLICGSLRPHHDLEERLAQLKLSEAALSFSSGYSAAIGVICALAGVGDTVILDKRCHASLVDGARLSGARLRVFRHNDLNDLEKILKWFESSKPACRSGNSSCLVVTESIFSMDGDQAPLPALVDLKAKYGGLLMVDEAHSTGLYGERGAGLAEHFQISQHVDIQMGTLGKALGSAGGFICGSRKLIDLIINKARSFIFSTAPPPATVAAAGAAVDFVLSEKGKERRATLWTRVDELRRAIAVERCEVPGAIIPIMVGEESEAVDRAKLLLDLGIYIPAIRYPSVPRKKARLRLTVTAKHSSSDIAQLAVAFRHMGSADARHGG